MTNESKALVDAAELLGYAMDLDEKDRIRIRNIKTVVSGLEGLPEVNDRKFLISFRAFHGRRFLDTARKAYQDWHNHVEEARYVISFLAGVLRRKLEASREIDPETSLKSRRKKAEHLLVFMIAEPKTLN